LKTAELFSALKTQKHNSKRSHLLGGVEKMEYRTHQNKCCRKNQRNLGVDAHTHTKTKTTPKKKQVEQ